MRVMRTTLSAFACSVLLCQSAGAIVGEAETADWSIVRPALLIASQLGVCSAAMIGRDLALTAAHCVTVPPDVGCEVDSRSDNQTVEESCLMMAGEFIVAGPDSGWIPVEVVRPHPQYDRSQRQGPDLALVKLAQPLPSNLAPALLATRPIQRGDRLTIVGYGINDTGKRDRIARMASFTVDESLRLIEPTPPGKEATLGAAVGDSGAPVFDLRLGSPLLVAIVTAGDGLIGRRTKIEPIQAHREWIWTTARELGSQVGP
jgi:V8-like Glu-specific endopeptidase